MRALAIALILLGALEGSMRLLGEPPAPLPPPAPYGVDGGRMRLEVAPLPDHPGWWRVERSAQLLSQHPLPGTRRVVVLGESAIQGFAKPPFQAVPWRLQDRLSRVDPGLEVLNLGLAGNCSHELVHHLERLVRSDIRFDLLLVHIGNNEFLPLMSGPERSELQVWAERLRLRLGHSWLYRYLRQGLVASEPGPDLPLLPREEWWEVRRADRRLVGDLYRDALTRLVATVPPGVDLVLSTVPVLERPPSGRGRPPGEHAEGPRVERLLARGDARSRSRAATLAACSQSPEIQRWLGTDLAERGRWEEARPFFLRALELDRRVTYCPPSLHEVVRDLGRRRGIPVCDVAHRLRQESRHGLLDEDLFLDSCHPNQAGDERIAGIFAEFLIDRGLVPRRVDLPSSAFQAPGSLADPVERLLDLERWSGVPNLRFRTAARETLEPQARRILDQLGYVNSTQDRSVHEVCRALSSLPGDRATHLTVAGHLLYTIYAFEEASHAYRQAERLRPSAVGRRNLAHARYAAQDWATALRLYRGVAATSAETATTRFRVRQLAEMAGR